jgi:hypothetical protein
VPVPHGRLVQNLDTRKKAHEARAADTLRKLLELIQAWGEEFLPLQKTHGLGPFVQLYHSLRARGFKFPNPQLDETRPPIFTPPASTEPSRTVEAAAPVATASESPALPSELVALGNSAEMLKEMIMAADSVAALRDDGLIQELVLALDSNASAVLRRIEDASAGSGSLMLAPLLELNDLVHGALGMYRTATEKGLDAIIPEPAPEPSPDLLSLSPTPFSSKPPAADPFAPTSKPPATVAADPFAPASKPPATVAADPFAPTSKPPATVAADPFEPT